MTAVTDPDIADGVKSPTRAPQPAPKALFILLVEDNEATRLIIQRMLRGKHRVVSARSCEEARQVVAALPSDSVDLLMSDMGLPDGHGSELLPQLRGMRTHARTTMLAT